MDIKSYCRNMFIYSGLNVCRKSVPKKQTFAEYNNLRKITMYLL